MEPENRDRLLEWLDDGCPPLEETGSADLTETEASISYLYNDLLHIAPELAAYGGLALDRDSDMEGNPGAELYSELFAAAEESDVILCSHAMLAMDMQLRQMSDDKIKVLPDFQGLLVDEAHSLEKTVANANSVNLSILGLKSALRSTAQGSKVNRKKAIEQCAVLIAKGQKLEGDDYLIKPREQEKAPWELKDILAELRYLAELLRRIFPKKKYLGIKLKDRPARIVQNDLGTLYRIINGKEPVLFNLSPVRRYLSVTTGPRTVEYLFKNLWDRVQGGCLLASATLTVPDKYMEPDAGYIIKILNIPVARCHVANPVIPAWLRKPVVLHVPKDEELEHFSPPKITATEKEAGKTTGDDGRFELWLTTVTDKICSIAESAAGGTLVLLTSYALLDMIRAKLTPQIKARSIYQDGRLAFGSLVGMYMDQAAMGKRPVWFAMGPAWEGLDLSGEHKGIPAEQDNILSDLVILRIPFGLNKSLAGQMRNLSYKSGGTYKSFPANSRTEAAFQFKQGVGRLVRREGVPPKHLWVLDGRIWTKNYSFYGVFQRILKYYKKSGEK